MKDWLVAFFGAVLIWAVFLPGVAHCEPCDKVVRVEAGAVAPCSGTILNDAELRESYVCQEEVVPLLVKKLTASEIIARATQVNAVTREDALRRSLRACEENCTADADSVLEWYEKPIVVAVFAASAGFVTGVVVGIIAD